MTIDYSGPGKGQPRVQRPKKKAPSEDVYRDPALTAR